MISCVFTCSNWVELWSLLSEECRDEILMIDYQKFMEAMLVYLDKHRYVCCILVYLDKHRYVYCILKYS